MRTAKKKKKTSIKSSVKRETTKKFNYKKNNKHGISKDENIGLTKPTHGSTVKWTPIKSRGVIKTISIKREGVETRPSNKDQTQKDIKNASKGDISTEISNSSASTLHLPN